MKAKFLSVSTEDEIVQLAQLANKIWFEYWPALIGIEQTKYMVEKFQSLSAIKRDLSENDYEYWFVNAVDDGRVVGYIGGRTEAETNRYFISKIYLLNEARGKGFASEAIRFFEELSKTRGLQAMYLTVNKGNELAVRAYLGKGFKTIKLAETDIGQGFIMDDFIMEKVVD